MPAIVPLLLVLSGCGSLTTTRVAAPSVDPRSAASAAMREYDKDGDGRLNETELAACPALSGARQRYDTDGDGQVSDDEIAQRLEQMYASGAGLLEVRCLVTRGGRPLAGATVRFIPEPFLGDSVQPASATTDSGGAASPSIPPDQLPDNLRSVPLMQAGLYRVEIEHPSIASAGNMSFGFEVDPTSRDGTMARFNL